MNDEAKKKLIRLAGYARSASGGVDTGFAAAPAPGKSLPQTPKPQGGGFLDKVGAVAKQTGGVLAGAAKLGGKFVINSAKDIGSAAAGTAQTFIDIKTQPYKQKVYADLTKKLEDKQNQVMQAYKSGSMTKENYLKALTDINNGLNDLNKENSKILDGPTPVQRAKDVTETAVNALSLGSLQLAAVGGKEVAEAGGKQAIKVLMDEGATNLEKLVLKFPVVNSLVERNLASSATRAASETTAELIRREGQNVVTNLLIKRPVFYQSNIGQAESLYKNMLEGDYKGALTDSAWLGLQMINGGPLGAAKNVAGYAKSASSKLAYGKGSFIDEVSSRIGDGNKAQIARFITKAQQRAPEEAKKIDEIFRVSADLNTRITKGKIAEAADNFLRTYTDAGIDLANVTPSQLYKDMDNWYQADKIWKDAAEAGQLKLTAEEAAKYTPVRWDASTRTAIANAVATAGNNPSDQMKALLEIADNPGVGFSNNNNLMLRVEKIIKEANSAEEAAKAIQAIDAAAVTPKYIDSAIMKKLNSLGYTIAEPVGGRVVPFIDAESTPKLISGAIKGSKLFDLSSEPAPVISSIASVLERIGLSPREANGDAIRAVSESVAASLHRTIAGNELGFGIKDGDQPLGGQIILSRLQRFIENKPGVKGFDAISAGKSAVTDIRQLTLNEISDALASFENGRKRLLDASTAKEIRKAILKGYQDVPIDVRGMGDKIQDTLYTYNPLQKYYSRIQSALRYTYNPFFRAQESAETKILSRIQSSNLLWNKSKAELDDAVNVLNKNNYFGDMADNIVHDTASLPGEAASDQVLGRITANLTGGQKRDLAGLALDIANRQGTDLDTLLKQNPEIIDDALRVVVQYPRKGILATSMARTMNLAFFPARYNAKVTMIAAQALAKEPPAIQKAVLHSMFNMKDWLQSDEGISWQSANADAIQLFKWITPINSIEATMKILTGSVNSIGDLGQLGGLPLGIITQILDGQGLINLNTPYVDPKTGSVFPKNIPQTTKARAAAALVDVLNSMFTYPGRTLGLPGKNEVLKNITKSIIDTKGTDFSSQVQMDRLTPLQQKWIEVLQNENATKEDIDQLYNMPAEGKFNWYTLPPLNIPTISPSTPITPVTPEKPSKTKASTKKQKKIARPIPL